MIIKKKVVRKKIKRKREKMKKQKRQKRERLWQTTCQIPMLQAHRRNLGWTHLHHLQVHYLQYQYITRLLAYHDSICNVFFFDAIVQSGQPQLTAGSTTGAESSFEEDVRRYLARKPMTTTEILKKIKSKRTGIQKDELMPLLVSALKRINPHKQKVKGVMYLSLKPNK